MRLTHLAALAASLAPALSAQAPARQQSVRTEQAAQRPAGQSGELEAELHYSTGADSWITTNKPAYVALFDLSRSSVTQLYPTFSAQADYPTGGERRLINVPQSAFAGGSPLFSNTAWVQVRGDLAWPHVLLLVASSSPLRVGSPWSMDISLNHQLLQQHHYQDVQTDAGIEALIDMVKPLDPNAEVAYDRVDGVVPRSRQYAVQTEYGGLHTSYLGYYCATQPMLDAYFTMAFWSSTTDLCVPVLPPKNATPPASPPRDTALHAASTHANATRAVSESRKIRDPAAIRSWVETYRGTHARTGSAFRSGTGDGSTLSFGHGGSTTRGDASSAPRITTATPSAAPRSTKPEQ